MARSIGADRPRAVVLDPIRDPDWDYALERRALDAAGADLVLPEDDDAADSAIADADVVVVTGIRRLDADRIAGLRRAVGILCYSIGMDRVDVEAARTAGIPVRNVPDYCTDEVADHALTLLLAAWRRLPQLSARAAAGDWAVHADPDHRAIRRLRGKTLVVVGAGRIGRAVAARARAFGMTTLGVDPYVVDAGPDLPIVPLGVALARADALVLCALLTDETRGLIGRDALARVPPGLILVNVARGGLIDEDALADAMREGQVAAAALDVRDPEPPRAGSDPLADVPGLLVTPHIAASSQEAVRDLQERAAGIVVELLRAGGRLDARVPGAA